MWRLEKCFFHPFFFSLRELNLFTLETSKMYKPKVKIHFKKGFARTEFWKNSSSICGGSRKGLDSEMTGSMSDGRANRLHRRKYALVSVRVFANKLILRPVWLSAFFVFLSRLATGHSRHARTTQNCILTDRLFAACRLGNQFIVMCTLVFLLVVSEADAFTKCVPLWLLFVAFHDCTMLTYAHVC
jgi:hypothetical protein